MTRILDPTSSRSKGRPSLKKKASKVNQIAKKKFTRKKTQKRSQKSTKDQNQEDVISNYLFICSIHEYYIISI